MPATPRFLPAGDRALIAEYGDRIDEGINSLVHQVARAVAHDGHPGIVEVVPTYRSLAIHFDPLVLTPHDVELIVIDAGGRAGQDADTSSRTVEVPVAYGGESGPDLADVAAYTGLSEAEVVAIHAGGRYRVYMMGFTPGFPYLGGMSPRIAAPRLATPRARVPDGSVGIAANQTGVYPTASPGGWRLIGRTPARLFDPGRTPPALLDAGDIVTFVAIDEGRFHQLEAAASAPPPVPDAGADAAIEVVDGGLLTTVQDLGRVGHQRCGVPVAGAMDSFALRAANLCVGNDEDAAGLEITLAGPVLKALRDLTIAVTGADLQPTVNGCPAPLWRPVDVHAGDTVAFAGRRFGLRAYLAVAGGIAVPLVLGSRSTYLASAFGGHHGRPLREGDHLPVGPTPARRPAAVGPSVRRAAAGSTTIVRVVLGPQDDAFTEAGTRTLLSEPYVLSARSDRVGCRFEGPPVEHRSGADIVSDGTAFGSVQVAGDGQPIVLMADRGTTGGYTKIATVVSADLWILAQAHPGDRVRFQAVSLDEAVTLARTCERALHEPSEAAPEGAGDDDVYDEDRGAAWAAAGLTSFAEALAGTATGGVGTAEGLRAGMTGQVVEVLVRAGETVTERQTLLVLEAMKMQNPVRAPHAGVIGRVLVSPGSLIEAGTTVVEFDT